MAGAVLADTSALLAFIDVRDAWHVRSIAAFACVRLPLVTTTAVMTELFHLAERRYGAITKVWPLFRSGQIVLAPILTTDLASVDALMTRYADRPMDFADATLVHVAEREKLSTILTVDHNDFETYRIGRNKRFRILPVR